MTSTPGAGAAGRRHVKRDASPARREPLPTRLEGLPELPAPYHDLLAAGLRALGLDGLPEVAREAIDGHVRLLLAWTSSINLTAIREPSAVARDHVLDSLAAAPILAERGVARLIDLGSGGGYPGVPLGLALGATRTLLVESVGKKARFLATVVEALGLAPSFGVAATRAERLAADPHHRGRWQCVVVRAVGSLAEDVELGLPLLEPSGLLVAWKRAPLDEQLGPARRALSALGGRIAEIRPVGVDGLGDHRLVVVEKGAASPAAYPRDPAVRKRRPW